jgi:hypothetical protein
MGLSSFFKSACNRSKSWSDSNESTAPDESTPGTSTLRFPRAARGDTIVTAVVCLIGVFDMKCSPYEINGLKLGGSPKSGFPDNKHPSLGSSTEASRFDKCIRLIMGMKDLKKKSRNFCERCLDQLRTTAELSGANIPLDLSQ